MLIHKFRVSGGRQVAVPMPKGAKVLCVQLQNGVPHVWAEVDPDGPKHERRFHWVPTGGSVPIADYVGTIQLEDGGLVFHLYDEGSPC